MKNLLFFAEEVKSKRYSLDVMFWSKSDSSIKIELKIYFSEITFSPQNHYSKRFVFEICRNEKLSIKNLTFWKLFFSNFHCTGKRLLQNLIVFFGKFHFNLWFSMKEFATKSCLLKWARKVKNLLLSAEQIESKRFLLDVNSSSKPDFSKKIEFKNWVSEKYFISRIWLFEMFCIRNLPERKILNSQSEILKKCHFKISFCRKKIAS